MIQESTQSALNSTVNLEFFLNTLGVFSTILLGLFTLLSAILGFLVWKNEEMRKKAQDEFKKVEELSDKISSMYDHLGILVKMSQAELRLMASRNDCLSKLLESAEGDRQKIVKTRDEVNKIISEIRASTDNLKVISQLIPSVSPSASSSSSAEYIPEVVKKALEMLREKNIKYNKNQEF